MNDQDRKAGKSRAPKDSVMFEKVIPALLIIIGVVTVLLIGFAVALLLGFVHL